MNDIIDENKRHSVPERARRKVSLYAVFSILALVAVCFTKTSSYQAMLENEVQQGLVVLGEHKWTEVNTRTIKMFNLVVVHSGFKKYFLDKVSRETRDKFPLAHKMNKLRVFGERIADNLQILLYQSLHRFNYFVEWLWLFVPFVLAQIISGIYYWKIRIYSFGNGTKPTYLFIGKLIKLTLGIVIFYFLLPGIFVDIMPYLPVFTIFAFGWLTKKHISNYQKVV